MRFEGLERPRELQWGAGVRFVGEHDEPAERELKLALRGEFAHVPGVRAAYLARVRYGPEGGSGDDVALCIRSSAPEDAAFTGRVGRVYGGRRPHLDVLFLSDEQEVALSAVCAPFYRAD